MSSITAISNAADQPQKRVFKVNVPKSALNKNGEFESWHMRIPYVRQWLEQYQATVPKGVKLDPVATAKRAPWFFKDGISLRHQARKMGIAVLNKAEQISAIIKDMWAGETGKELRAHMKSPEVRRRRKEQTKKTWQGADERRAAVSAMNTERWSDPKARAKYGKGSRLRWKDPLRRAKMIHKQIQIHNDPKVKEKHRERAFQQFKDLAQRLVRSASSGKAENTKKRVTGFKKKVLKKPEAARERSTLIALQRKIYWMVKNGAPPQEVDVLTERYIEAERRFRETRLSVRLTKLTDEIETLLADKKRVKAVAQEKPSTPLSKAVARQIHLAVARHIKANEMVILTRMIGSSEVQKLADVVAQEALRLAGNVPPPRVIAKLTPATANTTSEAVSTAGTSTGITEKVGLSASVFSRREQTTRPSSGQVEEEIAARQRATTEALKQLGGQGINVLPEQRTRLHAAMAGFDNAISELFGKENAYNGASVPLSKIGAVIRVQVAQHPEFDEKQLSMGFARLAKKLVDDNRIRVARDE